VSACGGEISTLGSSDGENSALGSCDQRLQAAVDYIDAAAKAADTSCQVDADCTLVQPGSDCCTNQCEGSLVSRMGAASVQAAIDWVNSSICGGFVQNCACVLGDCPAQMSVPACLNGTCVMVPPATWFTLYFEQSSSYGDFTFGSLATPPSCGTVGDCTMWQVSTNGTVVASSRGAGTQVTLSATDYSTVDRILRSTSFRAGENTGFQCDPAPTGAAAVALVVQRDDARGQFRGFDVTGCVLSGPSGNDVQRLYEVICGKA
jgi:hypothetical protein